MMVGSENIKNIEIPLHLGTTNNKNFAVDSA